MIRLADRTRLALTIVGCATAAATTALGLTALAAPDNYRWRLAEVERKVAFTEQQVTQHVVADGATSHAICANLGQAELDALRVSLASRASQVGVTLVNADIEPLAPAEADAPVVPVGVRLGASGPYDKVLTFIDALFGLKPEVFVDELDLRPSASGVDLKLSGKAFCWSALRR